MMTDLWVSEEQIELDGRVHAPQSARVCGQRGPAPLAAGVDDPASENVEGVGGLELSFDRRGVGGAKPAHDNVRMGREVVKEHTGAGS